VTSRSAGRPAPAAADDAAAARTRGLHRFAVFTALWTFTLLFMGGMVTSREAGLAVADWPLSYGYVINPPGWTDSPHIRVEHSHRLLGWELGILMIVLAFLIQRIDPRPWMRRLGWAALALVCVQGILGGYFRVVLLQHNMAIVHGCLGQAFFCVMIALALFTSPGWRAGGAACPEAAATRLRRLSLWAVGAIYLQVVVGALIRHSRVGHEIAYVLPHIVWGLVAAVLGLRAMAGAFDGTGGPPALTRPAALLGGGLLLQVLLGLGAYMANAAGAREFVRPPSQFWTTTAHQAAGALVLAAAVVLHLRARQLRTVPAGAGEGLRPVAGPAVGEHPAGAPS